MMLSDTMSTLHTIRATSSRSPKDDQRRAKVGNEHRRSVSEGHIHILNKFSTRQCQHIYSRSLQSNMPTSLTAVLQRSIDAADCSHKHPRSTAFLSHSLSCFLRGSNIELSGKNSGAAFAPLVRTHCHRPASATGNRRTKLLRAKQA